MELAIGIAALILSLASLLWQGATWKWQGPRPVVDVAVVRSDHDHDHDRSTRVLAINVSNRGRTAVQVLNVHLVAENRTFGFDPWQYVLPSSPTVPVVVEGHCAAMFTFDAGAVCAALAHHEGARWDAVAVVLLGNQRTVQSGVISLDLAALAASDREIRHGNISMDVTTAKRRHWWRGAK